MRGRRRRSLPSGLGAVLAVMSVLLALPSAQPSSGLLSAGPLPPRQAVAAAAPVQLSNEDADEAPGEDPALFDKHNAFYDLKSSQMHAAYWRRQLLQYTQPAREGAWHLMAVGGMHMREIVVFLCQMLSEDFRVGKINLQATALNCTGMWGRVTLSVNFYYAVATAVQSWEPLETEQPAVVLMDGAGIDILHTLPNHKWLYYSAWSNYNENLRAALEHLDQAKIPCVFVTTSGLCEDKFEANHRWVARYCNEQSDTLRTACQRELSNKVGRLHMDGPCFHGCRNEKAAERLAHQDLNIAANFRSVEVVNAYALTAHQCWATAQGDGIHFRPLVPAITSQALHHLRKAIESAGVG